VEVKITVPHGTDISKIEAEYPDIYIDWSDEDGDVYFIGSSSGVDGNERDSPAEWLTYDEAIASCGFVDGVCPDADTLMEGGGTWAMSEIQKTEIYQAAFERGKCLS
jgi:hypothetical protein